MNDTPQQHNLDRCATIQPEQPRGDGFLPVRGADGRLYGRFHPGRMLLEVRKGRQSEVIDLSLLSMPEGRPD